MVWWKSEAEFTTCRECSILVPTTYCMSHCGLMICANICLQGKRCFPNLLHKHSWFDLLHFWNIFLSLRYSIILSFSKCSIAFTTLSRKLTASAVTVYQVYTVWAVPWPQHLALFYLDQISKQILKDSKQLLKGSAWLLLTAEPFTTMAVWAKRSCTRPWHEN